MKKKEANEVVINAEVTRANQVNDTVFFDMVVNGVTIYGCKVVEGSKGDFISFPSHKGKDGKYYNYAYVKLSEADSQKIIAQVEEKL